VKVASIQLGPASPTARETTDRIVRLIQQAGRDGVVLASLPELALSPYFAADLSADPAKYSNVAEIEECLGRISRVLAEYEMCASLGFAEATANCLYNSMVFFGADGERLGIFRKVHIPGQLEPKPDGAFTIFEKRFFAPGDLRFPVVEMHGAKAGGLICYDRRFPESYRSLTSAGAEIILIGYNTPVSPTQPGATVAKGRRASEMAMRGGAYFTASFVLGAGKAGVENGVRYIGGSNVIGPDGQLLNRAKTMGDEVVPAEIDLAKVAELRERWAFDVNMRPDVYSSAADIPAPVLVG
jgi:hypothetical protein